MLKGISIISILAGWHGLSRGFAGLAVVSIHTIKTTASLRRLRQAVPPGIDKLYKYE